MKNGHRNYLEQLIAEGEHEHQDFKYQITDAKKIARSISAFANNTGGHLLVGVKDNGHIVGVSSDEEIYMVEQAATMYCQPPQHIACKVLRCEGKNVLKVDIAEAELKPVKAPDEHGQWKTYFRVADENILASATHVKVLAQRDDEEDHPVMEYGEVEHALLNYLDTHGGITVGGLMRLAHVSRPAAERTIVNLCRMGVVTIQYHDAQCLVTLP